jgi:hypothetical protein
MSFKAINRILLNKKKNALFALGSVLRNRSALGRVCRLSRVVPVSSITEKCRGSKKRGNDGVLRGQKRKFIYRLIAFAIAPIAMGASAAKSTAGLPVAMACCVMSACFFIAQKANAIMAPKNNKTPRMGMAGEATGDTLRDPFRSFSALVATVQMSIISFF